MLSSVDAIDIWIPFCYFTWEEKGDLKKYLTVLMARVPLNIGSSSSQANRRVFFVLGKQTERLMRSNHR